MLKPTDLPRIRLHDLRHSFPTILLAAGEHPKVVQEMLGHCSVELDTDSHLLPDLKLKERAAAPLDALLTVGANKNCGRNSGQNQEKVVAKAKRSPVGTRSRSCCASSTCFGLPPR